MTKLSIVEHGREAVLALRRRDDAAALEHLLGAWRQSQSERIASLVERLSQWLTVGGVPISFDQRSFVLSPPGIVELPLLLAGLRELAQQRPEGKKMSDKLKAFSPCSADPRFTPALLDIARLPVARVPEVRQALCNLFVEMWDPRAVRPLRELHAEFDPLSAFAEALAVTLERIAPRVRAMPPLPPEVESQCEEMEAALDDRGVLNALDTVSEELLSRVYADPEDVSARLVLADHLLERGHPLGELIMLQCSPQADRGRIGKLLEVNAPLWSSVLGPYVQHADTRFERGFPSFVRLRAGPRSPLLEPTVHWRTVRAVDLSRCEVPDLAKWLSHPHLRGVTVVKGAVPSLVRALAGKEYGVQHLEVSRSDTTYERELFARLVRLPKLTRLFMHGATPLSVQECSKSPLASRLEHFEVHGSRWALVCSPAKDGPVQARLTGRLGDGELANAIFCALGFGKRALHVQVGDLANRDGMRLLEKAASGYQQVEWS
ncbi:TIGR02996 domain-containing protein [Pyxidicoccus parkwayensis]|uniref:TIGR02996 domain-containing protein n=1 Tax=Pyxidicoccus parkwayensis TaxID=2813578 RepID=A0ABX7NSN3_9BACT|nr:TIGR02996 domain-containing protein [Pyxidicoccus parkwaysis]QSQ21900.1 TIGR02996 domain-containing protein [Pyxidicoccus parkwaysis]